MENQPTAFPDNFDLYCKQHPEKFEQRTDQTKRVLYIVLLAACVGVLIFPRIIPLFPLWMIYAAAILGALICLMSLLGGVSDHYNKQSGGRIREICVKKFDRVNTDETRIMDAFARRDFDFLYDAAYGESEPLQLYLYEDKKGREFYCHLRKYFSPSDFRGITEVITVSGPDYDRYESVLHSMQSSKK